jgi:hypothetical protein
MRGAAVALPARLERRPHGQPSVIPRCDSGRRRPHHIDGQQPTPPAKRPIVLHGQRDRAENESRSACGTSIGRGMDHPGWPRRRLHSPRAERTKVRPPVPPSAQSVQTKKKPPVDLAISA